MNRKRPHAMPTLLYRLGRLATRRPWRMIGSWLESGLPAPEVEAFEPADVELNAIERDEVLV